MIDVGDIRAARERLAGVIPETPCPYSETLSALTGARVFVKLENLQMTGSFKERGAANLLLQLSPAERERGVVAASAGNHGLAVAFHAELGDDDRLHRLFLRECSSGFVPAAHRN